MAKLVYIWENGEIPEGYVVDHIDGNTLNCHPSNLRLVDEKFNLTENKRDWKYPPVNKDNLEKFKEYPVCKLCKMMGEWIEAQKELSFKEAPASCEEK